MGRGLLYGNRANNYGQRKTGIIVFCLFTKDSHVNLVVLFSDGKRISVITQELNFDSS